MAARCMILKVTLVSGRGEEFDPAPGRILAIPPRTTYAALAEGIDRAFGRYDLAHLVQFEFDDGLVVTDEETIEELDDGSGSPRYEPLERPLAELTVGVTFTYTFDLGDNWLHQCEVLPTKDAQAVPGGPVRQVMPFDGWGDLPDQYGRDLDPDDETDIEPGSALDQVLRRIAEKHPPRNPR
ncbi:plasmid pRiA4b ORF-3 family protein [Arsenicicoccus bolidensis]|uniref:Plasmid pRiA4b ORF-3 family protein n=1 Tax=Arsenicicoccus bolidensis TaxID=229480 RepID=A0ABS9PYY3_9MICO|nr:plasmid pRiA4b ORF-3 family protein [Arsenicicoccus bolidensis]MCG7320846.1 plasmid pRiA4b ORF-3 family protein [Arsenicicoccus bolidensis]